MDTLRQADFPCLAGVRPETFDKMLTMGNVFSLKRKENVYRAGEKQDVIFFLVEGQAILYTLTKHGNRKIIFILKSGEMLSESVIHTDRTSVFCSLIRDSRILRIPALAFLQLMQEDFSLVKAVLEIQERKLWRTSHQLKNTMGSIQLERKLAAKLWKLARDFPLDQSSDIKQISDCREITRTGEKKKHSVCIDIHMTITFLADLLGAPRETTSRLCSNLVAKGLISMDKKSVTVLDMDGLALFYKEK